MIVFRIVRGMATVGLLLGAMALLAAPDDPAYRASVEKWRQAYEADLKSPDGWLSVAGLFWLHEGENSFGSGPRNDIVLPATAPVQAGTFEFHNGKTTVHAKQGATITLNGKPVESADLRPDVASDRIRVGELVLFVHASGSRFAIRLKDPNSKLRKDFTGLHWFPIDSRYRVVARFAPYATPRKQEIPNVLGDMDDREFVGSATFTLNGQGIRLEAEQDDPTSLSFVFRDLTSGKQTYPAARFLDTDAPKNGIVVMDFNEAYNPPCAYNPYTTCPLPTQQNRLRVAIPAGEMMYSHDH